MVTVQDIPFVQFLDRTGSPVGSLPSFAKDSRNLIPFYKAMVRTRVFDEKVVALQRTGRMGTYASSLGQEAVSIGIASAMAEEDVFLPSFREQGGQLWRGVSMVEILQFWGGDERGSDFKGPAKDFPVCIPVASQFPHAAGVGLAMRLRSEHRVAVVVGGDGSTSKGDFYEALNVSALWSLPVVFVVTNNQWAISVPRNEQTAADTLAHKAISAGMPGEQVDGNDVIAVHECVGRARKRALGGEGPTLIEAVTYRLSDHTTADDASRYREDTEVTENWKHEPNERLRTYLAATGVWTKEDEEQLLKDCRTAVDDAAQTYLALEPELPRAMFDYLFERRPAELDEQYTNIVSARSAEHA